MPTYEYECDKCGGQFEYFQAMSDAPKTVCEKCGGHLTKLLSAGSGLIFKGSGFYITDYKGKGGGEGKAGGEGKSSGESKSGGESKGGDGAGASATKSEAKSSGGATGAGSSGGGSKE